MAKIDLIIQQGIELKEYKNLKLYNLRILSVLNFVIINNINGINSTEKFLSSIKYPSDSNIYKILKGEQGFKVDHIDAVRQVYNVDMNYLFDEKHTEMFIQDGKKVTAYHRLLEVVHMIGLEINK